MLPILLALAVVAQAQDPPEDSINGAIFSDIWMNATIGNGNPHTTMDWAVGDEDHPAAITIGDRRCHKRGKGRRCTFTLARKPDPLALPDTVPQPRILRCTADLVIVTEKGERSWGVVHRPPLRGRGHSRTTMQCLAG